MNIWLKLKIVLICLVLQACGGGNSPDIKGAFQQKLPQGWQLESFKIEAKEDVGSKVEPEMHVRFKAEVSPKEHLHKRVGNLLDTDVLRISTKKGTDTLLHGTVRFFLRGEGWEGWFDVDYDPLFQAGSPASAFNAKRVIHGSSDYKKLLESAKSTLGNLEKQVREDEVLLTKATADYRQLEQELQEKVRSSDESLRNIQQQIQQQKQQIHQQTVSQNRDLSSQQQAQRQQQLAEFKAQLDSRTAEIERQHRLKTAEFSAERTKAQQAKTEQRNKARTDHGADLNKVRPQMDRAAYTIYKAKADEDLREQNAAIDARYNERIAQIKAQETEWTSHRRSELDKYNAEYRQKSDAVSRQLAAETADAQAGLNQQQREETTQLDAQLAVARKAHQELMNDNNRQLSDTRTRINQLQNRIAGNRSQLSQGSRQLALLEESLAK